MRGATPALGPAERRLLLACGRTEFDAERAEEVQGLLAQPLDWEAIAFYARVHSVGPLLHRSLKRLDEGAIPREARRALLAQYQRAAYQNRIYARENGVLIDALQAAGVPTVVPKGISIAERAYGGIGLRPLIDLIFLVPPAAVATARRVFAEHGYSREPMRPVEALFRWRFPMAFFRRRSEELQISVVLQEGLVTFWPRPHNLSAERILADARSATLDGREVLIPSPVDQLIYLALQADNSGYFNRAALGLVEAAELLFAPWSNNRLVRFVDIHEQARSEAEAIDWPQLEIRARETLLEDSVHTSLTLTSRLLGLPAPTAPPAQPSPPARPRLRRWLAEGVALDGTARPGARLAGSGWRSLAPHRQIRLSQLIGLGEYAFPGRATLRRLDGDPTGGYGRFRYARHAGATVARSVSNFGAALRRTPQGGESSVGRR